MVIPQDTLWQAAIEDFFDAFLLYFFPEAAEDIDWARPAEFLDKELAQLFPDHAEGHRRADKLAKVWLKSGEEHWFLVHVEAQGYDDQAFARRMFTYYYRILDKYDKEITAVVIYTNEREEFQPDRYARLWLGTELLYRFQRICLSRVSLEDLDRPGNPFARVMQIAWAGVKTQRMRDPQLYEHKAALFRKMLDDGYDKARIRRLTYFLKHFVHFANPELEATFEQQIVQPQSVQKTMGIIEVVHDHYRKLGLEEGRAEGRMEGRTQAFAEAEQTAKRQVIINLLNRSSFSDQDIADLSGATLAFVQEVRKDLAQG